MDRTQLERRYAELVQDELPAAARAGGWVVRANHCFGRLLLDDAVGCCWYDVLDRRKVAYRQLSDEQLRRAVDAGERMLIHGDPLVRQLNTRSLDWREKG